MSKRGANDASPLTARKPLELQGADMGPPAGSGNPEWVGDPGPAMPEGRRWLHGARSLAPLGRHRPDALRPRAASSLALTAEILRR